MCSDYANSWRYNKWYKDSRSKKIEPVNGTYSGKIATLKQDVHDGTFTFDTGDSYEGKWSKKVIQGKGKYVYKDLGTYEGDFKKGQRSGLGTFTWNGNSQYVGQWKKDKINGKGVYTYSDGGKLEGEFKDNQFYNGKYTITINDTTYKYKISDSTLSPSIEITYKDHGNYKGSYEGNKLTGSGTFTYANIDEYYGGVLEGKNKGVVLILGQVVQNMLDNGIKIWWAVKELTIIKITKVQH